MNVLEVNSFFVFLKYRFSRSLIYFQDLFHSAIFCSLYCDNKAVFGVVGWFRNIELNVQIKTSTKCQFPFLSKYFKFDKGLTGIVVVCKKI